MIKFIQQTIDKILKEQRDETLTFEKDPIEYIVQKFPSLDATLIDLMTEVYKDYLTGIYVMAPKPTTFKILLHNGHSFYLIYSPKAYICKVSGKKYNLIDLKDEEYAIKAISNLLLLGIPPGSEGPNEEVNNENDSRESFASDMTSEPNLGDDFGDQLDNLDTTPSGDGGEPEPEDELQETVEEPKKSPSKFRIVKK